MPFMFRLLHIIKRMKTFVGATFYAEPVQIFAWSAFYENSIVISTA